MIEKLEINNLSYGKIKEYIKSRNIIYPETLYKELNISISKSFELLNLLKDKDLLERVYEFRCPCLKYRKKFEKINYINLPTDVHCISCKNDYNTRDNLYIIYQVI